MLVGSFLGVFVNMFVYDFGVVVLKVVLECVGVDVVEVLEIILGQVLIVGQGQNLVCQVYIKVGLLQELFVWLINQVCGLGLCSVVLVVQQVLLGDVKIVIVGGQEFMLLLFYVVYIWVGQKMGDMKLLDIMICDGLWDVFYDYYMGQIVENVVNKWDILCVVQDQFVIEL